MPAAANAYARRTHPVAATQAPISAPLRSERAGRMAGGRTAAFDTVELQSDIAAAGPIWRGLSGDALATPYQRLDLLKSWSDHVAGPDGVEPAVFVARDAAGAAVALLPFGVRRRYGVSVAGFLGGSHVNYNVPVIRRDRIAAFDAQETMRLVRAAADAAGVDAFVLRSQPFEWDGAPNPFVALPRQPSSDPGFCGPLAPSLEEHLKLYVSAKSRSNQRRKMRRFEERGRPRIYRAETPEDRARLLDAYFRQKSDQFASRGIANIFDRPGVHAFLSEASTAGGGAPTIDLYGFDLNDEVIAVTGGVSDGARYCGMFVSITTGEHAKYSPGEMIMNFVVEDAISRGLSTFDLGVGAAVYKKMYCPIEIPLFDSIFGVTAKGRAAAAVLSATAAGKTWVKATPWAYDLANRVRMTRARRDGGQDREVG